MKERMITRTVNGYSVNTLVFDMEKGAAQEMEFTMGADFKPEKAIDCMRKEYESDSFKIVAIKGYENRVTRYGMTEAKFIRLARKMAPRGTDGRTRERLVTRTVNGYKVTALAFSMVTMAAGESVYEMGADFDTKKPLEALRAACENDMLKILEVRGIEETAQLYGMSERDFILFSEELPLLKDNEAEETEAEETEN